MCGIAAIISRDAVDAAHIKTMCDSLRHRGPDGSGYLGATIRSQGDPRRPTDAHGPNLHSLVDEDSVVDGPDIRSFGGDANLWLGHRRLSILDLSPAGHQPMTYLGRYHIVFNGEVYNYLELRRDLQDAGYEFRTGTDTEVILAAYDYWGADCLTRFNGMWAFVLLDSREGVVFVARDRVGIKPLHYFWQNGALYLASEIKAILALPFVSAVPNERYCTEFLRTGPREYGGESAFDGIGRFPNGQYMRCGVDHLLRTRSVDSVPFWSIEARDGRSMFSMEGATDAAGRYRGLLRDAVRLRLRSDVAVGSALSGGLDSSSIVSLINDLLRESGRGAEQQKTFSSVYRSPGVTYCDESDYIVRVAEFLGVRSSRIEPRVDDVPEEHRQMIYAMDTPPAASMMSSWHTFKLVRDHHVTVTLDGQGADEQLAGYFIYFVNHLVRLSRDVRREYKAIRTFPGAATYARQGLLFRALCRSGALRAAGRSGRLKSCMPLNERLATDLVTLMANLLHYADRTSMAWSVESRVPFLDHRLIEFLAGVPAQYKIHDGWTKYLARVAFDGLLPNEITWRKDKLGWPIPDAVWFGGPLRPYALDVIGRSRLLRQLGSPMDVTRWTKPNAAAARFVRRFNLAVWEETFL